MDVEDFICSVCLNICCDAVEASCCTQIFCDKCVAGLQNCPTCRKSPFVVTASAALRRFINNMKIECKNCKLNLPRKDSMEHSIICPQNTHKCLAPGCDFSGLTESFKQHMISSHEKDFLRNINSIFKEGTAPVETEELVKNDKNRVVTFNEFTNKPYCSGPLLLCSCRQLSTNSSCANRICGPDGCNCKSCMRLHLQIKELPPGTLINNRGRAAVRNDAGRFYCRIENCGTKGLTCSYCKKLDYSLNSEFGIYKDLVPPKHTR